MQSVNPFLGFSQFVRFCSREVALIAIWSTIIENFVHIVLLGMAL